MFEDDNIPAKNEATEAPEAEAGGDLFDDVFESPSSEVEAKEEKEPKSEKGAEAKPKEQPKQKADKKAEIQKLKKELAEDETDEKPVEKDAFSKELEKTKKALSDTKKWGHANSQKLKNAMKKVEEYVGNNLLTDEEAKSISDILTSEARESEEEDEELTPMQTVLKIANEEVDNIKKYTDDEAINDKMDAFDFFIMVADKEEYEETKSELFSLRADKLKMTKRMLAIGQKYYEEFYKDIKEAGGYSKLVEKKNEEVRKLQKKVDKLTKLVSQYDDVDAPVYRIDELTDSDKIESGKADVFNEIF